MAHVKKSKVTTDADFEAELKGEVVVYTPTFDSSAITILKKEKGFNLVRIPIDSKTLATGPVEIIDTAENKLEANEKYKIAVVRNGIL